MVDYSRYGGISPDWTAYMAANPQPQLPPNMTPIELRERTNAGRESNSKELLKLLTGNPEIVMTMVLPLTSKQRI